MGQPSRTPSQERLPRPFARTFQQVIRSSSFPILPICCSRSLFHLSPSNQILLSSCRPLFILLSISKALRRRSSIINSSTRQLRRLRRLRLHHHPRCYRLGGDNKLTSSATRTTSARPGKVRGHRHPRRHLHRLLSRTWMCLMIARTKQRALARYGINRVNCGIVLSPIRRLFCSGSRHTARRDAVAATTLIFVSLLVYNKRFQCRTFDGRVYCCATTSSNVTNHGLVRLNSATVIIAHPLRVVILSVNNHLYSRYSCTVVSLRV